MNIQNDGGKAKEYQVRQVLAAIEKKEMSYGEQAQDTDDAGC